MLKSMSATINIRMLTGLLAACICLLYTGCSQTNAGEATSQHGDAATCKISLVDDSQFADFSVNEKALTQPLTNPTYKRAYFSMGCFWGSEALMGSAHGVVLTRVGFTGGTLPNPSYSAIGDHVETVEVLYDPERTDYVSLLRHFWSHHNARAKPIFRQYASAVFCSEKEEIELAKTVREEWEQKGEEKVLTAVLPLNQFYPAAENHQKYYLQQDPKLLQSLPGEDRLSTVLATKLNAISGRAGERESLEKTLSDLGVDTKAQAVLFNRAVWPEAPPKQ